MTDPKLLELNKEVAEELGLPESLTKHVFNYIITDVRNQIINASTKEIMIHYFGTFKIPENSLEKIEEKLVKSYKKGNITKAKFEKGLTNLKKVRERY